MDKKIFKGFKQVTSAAFNSAKEANELAGYLWFVRTEVRSENEGEANDVVNDEYDIYFGARQYGHFTEGEIPAIKASIESLNGDIAGILTALEGISGTLDTHTQSIADNKLAHEANASAIQGLQTSLANYLVKSVDTNDKVLNVADGILSSEIGLVYENGYIRLTGKGHTSENANIIAEFDASEFVKDSVLEDVDVTTKEDGEKYIVFTWKTEGETTKTDEIKVSDFAKLYEAGTALELAEDGVTFNVKVAANDNFISVNNNNELIVDDITTDKTMLKEAITIEGGPLATTAVKNAFEGGVIPAGTDIQAIFKALLCVEIYPAPTANTPSYSVSISNPSLSITNSSVITTVGNDKLVEVGQTITFSSVTANAVSVSKTQPKVSGFNVDGTVYGYSSEIDGTITKSDSVSGEWTVSQKDETVYKLSGTIVSGFTGGTVPTAVENAAASACTLSGCTLTAVEGTNTYKVTEDGPMHTGSHNGVGSKYIVSNLGGRKEEKKSPSIAATTTNVEHDPSNASASLSVIGVYPIFTNGVTASTTDATAAAMTDLAAHVSGDGTKLPLMKSGATFAVSFAAHTKNVEGYRLYLPGNWKVTSALAINANTAKYAVDQKSKFVAAADKVKRTIQGKEVEYTVYEYLATEGANRVKFTVG